jgi:hypothetical protein
MSASRLLAAFLLLVISVKAAPVIETDVCVYGGTSGGVIAAVQAARQGKSVALLVFGNHVGGMTSGGLGQTDVGNNNTTYIQGVAREYYNRMAAFYNVTAPKFISFEPHVAENIFKTMLTEVGVTPRYQQHLVSVTKSGQRITEIAMDNGTIYRAKMFIDASYEGDLMAQAGVTFTIGREANAQYGETLNGIRGSTPAHQFTVNVDPYNTPGNPASGLLPFIQPQSLGTAGAADNRVQAYNYRLCLTTAAANKIAITPPAGYNEAQYELLGRLLDANPSFQLTSLMNISGMPNSKTDINNNGAFSTDFIGMSDSYPTATYAQRMVLEQQFKDYTQGFLYYLGHSARSPSAVRTTMLTYGFCADEFADNGGFGTLYVREARRMVSDYVMRQQNCQGSETVPDSIGLASYTMDAHNAERIVQGGVVKNEGDVQQATPAPYGISYRSIIPKVGECQNLIVPWCLSASHVGFGSIRMEPVGMILGQSAGTAAAIAIDDNVPVQQVSYAKLALQLTADGQMLSTSGAVGSNDIFVDNADATGVTITGAWTASTSTAGYYGGNYLHDGSMDKGTKSVRFTPTIPTTGDYDVYLRWTAFSNRAINVPVDVIDNAGTQTFTIDQTVTANGGIWYLLKRSNFTAGTTGSVLVRTTGTVGTGGTNTGTNAFVVADVARFVPVSASLPAVQIVASDAETREGAANPARFTVLRPSTDTALALTVNYTISGTATNGVDYNSLPGSVTMAAGSATATIPVQAVGDAIAEGTETLTLTVAPGTGYNIGPVNAATIKILDRPIDDWRHTNFTAAQLADPNASGDLADLDQDNVQTLAEYALGLDPNIASALPVPQNNGGYLTLTYTHRKSATDTTVTVEATHDLKDWSVPVQTQQVGVVDQGELELITVRLTTPMSQDFQGFLRLKVTRP